MTQVSIAPSGVPLTVLFEYRAGLPATLVDPADPDQIEVLAVLTVSGDDITDFVKPLEDRIISTIAEAGILGVGN